MVTSEWGAIYRELGARPVLNATGSVTLLGGSTPVPEVKAAMDAADSAYIPLIELQKAAGKVVADAIGVPAAYFTSGAGSALTLVTAAMMAGDDDNKIEQLPDTTGMRNEILIQKRQRYWYDRCLQLAGAKLVEFGTDEGTTEQDLIDAIGDNTVAVHFYAHEQDPVDPKILPVETIIRIAHEKGVYATVDAAGQIYPLENFGKYVKMGADFQCIAAKYMGAPHSTGMALGTEEMIHLISLQSFTGYETRRIRGIGRPQKMDRQEIVGVVAAVKRWFRINHEDRLALAEQMSNELAAPLKGVPGVKVEMNQNIIGHQPFGVFVTVDPAVTGMTNQQVVDALREYEPSIWTRVPDGADRITLHVFGLDAGQPEIVGKAIRDVVTR
ncbi:MAG: aminotransferase class V-fold PLP-dependent enzyme [Chloroflexi bacterium]|nr:aminotransferase class V-fold PLP-dependent enzyme [Chloroflexota bacterium]